jgi:hypothetical protein
MRYLKRQNINRRVANDPTLYTSWDATNTYINMNPYGGGALVVPSGTNANQPAGSNGMLRYNTDIVTGGRLEVYSNGRWRGLRYAEQGPIIQQNLGAGDGSNIYFGPLNSTYYNPSNNASNSTVGGQNIIVVVENVIQLNSINYTVVNNPSAIQAETYTPTLGTAATVGSSTLYFNTSITGTGASGNGSTVTLTFSTQTGMNIPFAIGATITVTGFSPSGYNGVFTVTASTTTSVSYTNTTSATMTFAGNITASGSTQAIFPLNTIVGATVSGPATIQGGTTVTSYVTDPVTDALLSVGISKPTVTSTIAVNTQITITEPSQAASGYYLQFTAPVPYGKVVTALLGFDS